MNKSDSIIKLIPDLLKAQKEIEFVEKNAKNPFFKSKYADLNAVINAVKEHLNNNNIAVLQPISGNTLTTVLLHTSGEWISSETNIVCKEQNNPQVYGSAVSYARRYGLQSMMLLSAEDDDGNSATQHQVSNQNEIQLEEEEDLRGSPRCEKCGAPMKTSKTTGKPYCSALCWKK